MILKIAWRNLLRHRSKSLIIGTILLLGSLIMTIGNGIISGMERGLKKNIVGSFSGDIVLVSQKQVSDDVFISMGMPEVESFTNFTEIEPVLKRQSFVQKYLPVGKNVVLILNESGGLPNFTDFAYVLGVDIKRYREVFPDAISLVEGRLPQPGEKLLLLSNGRRREVFKYSGVWFNAKSDSFNMKNFMEETGKKRKPGKTKSSLVCMGLNDFNAVTDIRQDITGIIRFHALNHMLTFGNMMIMDIESYRLCMGYIPASERTIVLSESRKALLSMDNTAIERLFGDQPQVFQEEQPDVNESSPRNDLTSASASEGAYNMVFLFTDKSVSIKKAVQQLNDSLAGLGVRAIPWYKAMPMIGQASMMIRMVLFSFVFILFLIAAILISNTLSMAVMERSSEIGVMRAIGAQVSWISKLFLSETVLLASLFGSIGILTAATVLKILHYSSITTDNDMLQLLFGGERLNPVLQLSDILLIILQLSLVILLSVLYPLLLARKVKPVDAVVRE